VSDLVRVASLDEARGMPAGLVEILVEPHAVVICRAGAVRATEAQLDALAGTLCRTWFPSDAVYNPDGTGPWSVEYWGAEADPFERAVANEQRDLDGREVAKGIWVADDFAGQADAILAALRG
jgi:hypothetical protein